MRRPAEIFRSQCKTHGVSVPSLTGLELGHQKAERDVRETVTTTLYAVAELSNMPDTRVLGAFLGHPNSFRELCYKHEHSKNEVVLTGDFLAIQVLYNNNLFRTKSRVYHLYSCLLPTEARVQINPAIGYLRHPRAK